MRFLIKLELINYLKHSHLIIDLQNGVNVIGGASGTGKSCIRCAIEDLYFNEDIKNSIKEGTKKSQIIATYSDGIEIEKVRSSTINRYILRKPNEEPQEFNKVGKEVPLEIKEIIGLDYYECDDEKLNLNIAQQIELPFLLDKSPTFRMKLFNQLTGNANIDELLSSYNKDIFNLNREIPSIEKDLESKNNDLNQKNTQLKDLTLKYNTIEDSYTKLQNKYSQYEQFISIFNKIKDLKEKAEFLQYKINQIKIPEVLNFQVIRDKIHLYEQLKTLLNALQSTKNKIAISQDVLKQKVLPELNIKEIEGKINRYDKLKLLYYSINTLNNKIQTQKIAELPKINIAELENKIQYYEILKTFFENIQRLKQQINEKKQNFVKIEEELLQVFETYEEMKKSVPKCDKCGQYIMDCKDEL